MTATTIATAIDTLVREDDLLQHIQDELTVNAIRDGKLVEVRWADLSEDEQRAAYCSTFDQAYILESLRQAERMISNIAEKYHLEYEDLYQEAYLLAHKRLDVLPTKANPRAYLQRAILSHLHSLAVRERWTFSLDEPIQEDEDETYADRLQDLTLVVDERDLQRLSERAQALYAALKRLPLEEQQYLREVFHLNAFDPVPLYPYCLNNPCRTRTAVQSRVYRALRRDTQLQAAVCH